jgi:CHAT domain-containing protein
LLGPVAAKLGKKRLVIVADGALQYLPFAALPAPGQTGNAAYTPLIVEHEIVNLPSASTLDVIRREAPQRLKANRLLAVFADPVFQVTDSRVGKSDSITAAKNGLTPDGKPATTKVSIAQALRSGETASAGLDLPRLRATADEANAVLAMVPEEQRWGALGFEATREAAMSNDLKRYQIVHFGTHTILNENHPDLSALVLSLVDKNGLPQNGFLRLRDMYNLKLSAELVVLSACETGIGKEIKGEGLMSMVRGFMYSGTPRVLASLWKIDDEGTSDLMKEFYKQLLQNNQTPAAALRQAQIKLWQSKSRKSPYYWAGFQLQGDWN